MSPAQRSMIFSVVTSTTVRQVAISRSVQFLLNIYYLWMQEMFLLESNEMCVDSITTQSRHYVAFRWVMTKQVSSHGKFLFVLLFGFHSSMFSPSLEIFKTCLDKVMCGLL